MVYLYAADTSGLPDPYENPDIMDGLWEERKNKILRYRQVHDRKQCLGAGLLLKEVFLRHGISTETLVYGENGKPEVEGFYFNLSHSDSMVICAVSNDVIGCDIEQISNIKDGFVERFFTENEVNYLNSFGNEEKIEEFFRLWTMKESYMKMTGEGMRLSLDRFEFVFEDSIKLYRDRHLCSCHIKEYKIPGYKLTICAKESEFSEKIDYIDLR